MTGRTVVVDPLTRIEGHLRIEAEIDANGKIINAISAGTMVRRLEIILKGRDPRDAWAFAQGISGRAHARACARFGSRGRRCSGRSKSPKMWNSSRNLMARMSNGARSCHPLLSSSGARLGQSDFGLGGQCGGGGKAAQSHDYPESSDKQFAKIQDRLKGLVNSEQLGIFTNGYWDHPGYKLPPEANLIALTHYLEGLAWQREIGEVVAIFGGKDPHPNVVVGGVPCAIASGLGPSPGGGDATAVNLTSLQKVNQLIEKMRAFIDRVFA